MPLHVSSTCAHRQEVKIVLYSLWYHHTYRCDDTPVVHSTSKNTHTRDAPQAQTDPNNMICCHTTTLSIQYNCGLNNSDFGKDIITP